MFHKRVSTYSSLVRASVFPLCSVFVVWSAFCGLRCLPCCYLASARSRLSHARSSSPLLLRAMRNAAGLRLTFFSDWIAQEEVKSPRGGGTLRRTLSSTPFLSRSRGVCICGLLLRDDAFRVDALSCCCLLCCRGACSPVLTHARVLQRRQP